MEGESQNLPAQQAAPEPPEEAEVVPEEPTAEGPLSQQERKRLTELEDQVEDGFRRWLETTAEIGKRLMAIHDERLYREDYASFEAYCNARWQIERAQGNRLVDYGRVAEAVSPTGDIPIPASERQARELAPLAKVDPKAARRVWKKLLDDNGGAKPRSFTQVNAAAQPEYKRLQKEQENASRNTTLDPNAPPSEEDPETSIALNDDRIPGWRRGDFGKKKNLRTLPDDSVRLLLCDPPYGVDRKTKSKRAHERIESDKTSEDAEKLLRRMLRRMRPKLKEDAHIVIFCAPINEDSMRRIVDDEPDLTIRTYPVWVKNAPSPGDTVYGLGLQHERMIHATKGKPAVSPGLFDRRPSDVFDESRVAADKHPTRKPAELMRKIIAAFTDTGELVADPVAGSGSTLVAALQRGRRAWGAEIAKGYYDEGSARIVEELNNPWIEEGFEDESQPEAPGIPAPEVPSETPPEAAAGIIERIYGLWDPLTDHRSSPPDDEASLFPLLRAWLASRSETPRTLVEPFAFYHGQSGLLAALAEPTLAEHFMLIENKEPTEVVGAWHTLLDEPRAARLVRSLGLLRYAFGSVSSEQILSTIASPEPPSINGEEISASPEAREALRLLFAKRPLWLPEMARAAAPREPIPWSMNERLISRPDESVRRLSEPLEESVRRLSEARKTGRVELRQSGNGLEALEDPKLAGDPETAFFVVPTRSIGHQDPLRLLAKVAGDGIAIITENRQSIARARQLGLDLRRLGSGRIAEHEAGTLLLVGKDLSWADTAAPIAPLLTEEERREIYEWFRAQERRIEQRSPDT